MTKEEAVLFPPFANSGTIAGVPRREIQGLVEHFLLLAGFAFGVRTPPSTTLYS